MALNAGKVFCCAYCRDTFRIDGEQPRLVLVGLVAVTNGVSFDMPLPAGPVYAVCPDCSNSHYGDLFLLESWGRDNQRRAS